jgi:hypothetical protein
MADAALQAPAGTGAIGVRPHLDRGFDPPTVIIFLGLLGAGLLSNFIQALASVFRHVDEHDETDRQIRLELPSRMQQQSWTDFGSRNGLNSLILRSEG